jgi:hypothetical protein
MHQTRLNKEQRTNKSPNPSSDQSAGPTQSDRSVGSNNTSEMLGGVTPCGATRFWPNAPAACVAVDRYAGSAGKPVLGVMCLLRSKHGRCRWSAVNRVAMTFVRYMYIVCRWYRCQRFLWLEAFGSEGVSREFVCISFWSWGWVGHTWCLGSRETTQMRGVLLERY